MHIKLKLLICSFLLCVLTSYGQLEKIDTDRPDRTESPAIVPKKWMQVELGFLKEVNKNPYPNQQRFKDQEFEHPALLIKYGLAKCFELRLITTYATSRGKEDNTIIDRENGIASVQLGGKVNFFSEKGLRPKTSLIAHYDFAGLRTLNKDSVDAVNFRFTMQHTLSEKISLGYNLGMEWERFDKPPAYIYTLTSGFDLVNNWSGFIEVFGSIWKNEKPEHSIDGGITYTVNPDFKLDISSGFGISKFAPDWFIGIGGSVRFKAGK